MKKSIPLKSILSNSLKCAFINLGLWPILFNSSAVEMRYGLSSSPVPTENLGRAGGGEICQQRRGYPPPIGIAQISWGPSGWPTKSQPASMKVFCFCISAVVLPVPPPLVVCPLVSISQKELLIWPPPCNPTNPPTSILPKTLPVE